MNNNKDIIGSVWILKEQYNLSFLGERKTVFIYKSLYFKKRIRYYIFPKLDSFGKFLYKFELNSYFERLV